MHRARRSITALAAAVGLILGAAACEPPPPDVVLVANSVNSFVDADPGDGVCDTGRWSSPAECTMLAAIQEGNALSAANGMRRVTIEAPGHPQLDYPVVGQAIVPVTGNIRIVETGQWFIQVVVETFHVAAGATLDIDVDLVDNYGCDGSWCPPRGETKFDVDGTLIVRDSTIHMGGFHMIRVNPGGTAVLDRVSIWGNLYWGPGMVGDGSQAIYNAGTVVLHRTGVSVGGVLGAVTTVGDGRTVMKDSSISAPARQAIPGRVEGDQWGPLPAGWGDACGGTIPESLGGNRAFDETCQPHRSGRRQRTGRPLTDRASRRSAGSGGERRPRASRRSATSQVRRDSARTMRCRRPQVAASPR